MSSMASDTRLSMSLDDLISAEKKTSSRRERSPRNKSASQSMVDDRKSGSSKVILRPNRESRRTVKVTNIPFDLTWKDIKSAFSEVGPVERCDVEEGVAHITFRDARDAQNAVKTYDGGDMNGRRIKAFIV
jgi:RNA recognition motif-containing protein